MRDKTHLANTNKLTSPVVPSFVPFFTRGWEIIYLFIYFYRLRGCLDYHELIVS